LGEQILMLIGNKEAQFQNASVLITRGLGFIGSNLACRFVTLGAG